MKPSIIKRHLSLISVAFLLCISFHSYGQTATQVSPLENFMRNRGVKDLASIAHPFNTYDSGSYSISGNYTNVEVHYSNGHYEIIKLHYEPNGDYFENIRSTEGQEYVYSYLATGSIVNGLSDTKKSCIENFFHTSFRSMSGEQIAGAVLTSMWWDWEGKSCK